MKLRKILTSAFVLLVCVAMLSTNVLAASVSIATGVDEDGKLKVTLSGDATGQVTFLATDASVALASVDGADIQYIDQIDKAASDRIITFAQRTGGENLVNIYAGGENVTTYASVANVYVVADAEVVDADYVYECAATADEFESADLTAFFTENDLVVDYRAVGSLASAAAEQITFSAANADDFDFEIGEPTDSVYPVAVTYKGIAADSVNVTAVPPATLDSISATFPAEYEDEVWVEEGADAMAKESAVKAKVEAIKSSIAVTGTYVDPDGTASITTFDFSVVETAVAGVYDVYVTAGGETSPEKITYTVRERAITGATVTGSKVATVTTRDAATVTEDDVIAAVKDGGDEVLKVVYDWNEPGVVTPATASDLNYAAVDNGNGTWTVTVTSTKATLTGAVVEVTIVINEAAGITGKLVAADSFGVENSAGTNTFTNAIPVGAVVTAVPKGAARTYAGNVVGGDTPYGYTAKSAMVDSETGEFVLELTPGQAYNIIISHTRYVGYTAPNGRFSVTCYKTVVNSNTSFEVTGTNDLVDLGTITLQYTYLGDLDLNGTVAPADYTKFTPTFNQTIPAMQN